MQQSFSVMLSKGAYVVDELGANAIIAAIEKDEKHVLVNADILGDGLFKTAVRIVTDHVISIVANATAKPVDPPEPTGRARLSVV